MAAAVLGGAGLIAINQRAFTGAISAGQQDMNGWTGYIPVGVKRAPPRERPPAPALRWQ